ncbi:MAG TPA: LEPR-XLL domain-containing protein [Planctomycetota bacterium]|nr:LEPR-XLL domain-containing protein [Planctomycetota bacterium]HRR79417.1 LEPR-XLL domain-containing protein [Planctomycetota bacterium]HRT93490.1 LEPR-XLL domain-containing protein [Planctomycetota bacterium]
MSHPSPSARPRQPRRLALEALEPRCLLSANITFAAGLLSVVGDAASDWIQVTDNGDGSAIVAVPSDPANAAPVLYVGVTDILIQTGDGNNRVDYRLDAAAVPSGLFAPANATIQAGLGKDTLYINLFLPAVQNVLGQAVDLAVDLVGGKNILQFWADGALPGVGEFAGLVNLNLLGGISKDSANLSFSDLYTNVTIDTLGVGGKDSLLMDYSGVPVGMPSPLTVRMSEGKDVFRLSASSPIPGDPASDGLLIAFDGLGGSDSCSMSFFDIFASVLLDMGLGNDSVAISYNGLAGSGFSSVLADLGEGKDKFTLTASSPLPLVPPGTGLFVSLDSQTSLSASLSFTDVASQVLINGDLGSDKVALRYRGVPDNSFVIADLGEGKNSFTLDARANPLDLPGIAPGALDVQVLGGNVSNTASLSFYHVFPSILVDVGEGNDGTYITIDGLPVGFTAPINVAMANGKNVFQILAKGDPPAGPPLGARGGLSLNLTGGFGSDIASMSFFDVWTDVTANLGDGPNSANIRLDAPVSLANGGAGVLGANTLFVTGGVSSDLFNLTLGSPAGTAGAVAALGSLAAFLDAGGGPNTVNLTVGGDVALGQDIAVTVFTGAGNDLLSLISRSIFCDGSVRLAADLGAGFDLFNGLVVADVNPTGLVDVAVGLGASTDDCNLQYRGQINGDVKLLVDGADGNDTIQAYIIPTVGSVGTLQAELYGGLNNDNLSFLMWGLQGQLPALTTNLLVDGGPNFDIGWVVNGVPVLNIEELHIAPAP